RGSRGAHEAHRPFRARRSEEADGALCVAGAARSVREMAVVPRRALAARCVAARTERTTRSEHAGGKKRMARVASLEVVAERWVPTASCGRWPKKWSTYGWDETKWDGRKKSHSAVNPIG